MAVLPNAIDLDQAHDRHERYAADAARARAMVRPSGAIRRAIGYRFIVLGRRIAAHPKLELARSSR
jgi:hypothetical protein